MPIQEHVLNLVLFPYHRVRLFHVSYFLHLSPADALSVFMLCAEKKGWARPNVSYPIVGNYNIPYCLPVFAWGLSYICIRLYFKMWSQIYKPFKILNSKPFTRL